MADLKISELTNLTAADPVSDMLPIVDVSATPPASGSTKRISINNLLSSSPTASGALTVTGLVTAGSASITGAATVGTTLGVTGASTLASASVTGALGAAGLNVTGATIPANGVYLGSANNLSFSYASTLGITLNSTGLGIGDAPATNSRLTIGSTNATGFQYALRTTGVTTGRSQIYLNNTSGDFIGGIESSVAGTSITGTAAYSGYVGTSTTNPFHIVTNGSVKATVDSSGNLLVGKTASSTSVAGAQVQPDGTHSAVKSDANPGFFYNTTTAISGTIALFRSNGVTVGTITQDGTNTAYVTSSDYRLKEAVQPMSGGLARVSALKPSIYKWKSNGSTGEGFLAHELAEVVPAAVVGTKDALNEDGTINPQGIDLSKIVPILVAAIQELTAEVNALKNA